MRAVVVSRALLHLILTIRRTRKPSVLKRVLIAHHLLLGDTLMLTPLIAKLREQHPAVEIVMAAPKAIAPLYEKRPYGLIAWSFDPYDPSTLKAMLMQPGFDLAIVPGDNRYAWLARHRARSIAVHAADRPAATQTGQWMANSLPRPGRCMGNMVAALVMVHHRRHTTRQTGPRHHSILSHCRPSLMQCYTLAQAPHCAYGTRRNGAPWPRHLPVVASKSSGVLAAGRRGSCKRSTPRDGTPAMPSA
jgi:hypothetical protein